VCKEKIITKIKSCTFLLDKIHNAAGNARDNFFKKIDGYDNTNIQKYEC
jgi:hypothetical protein